MAAGKRKLGLTGQIIIAMFFGVFVGVILRQAGDSQFVQDFIIGGLFHVVGKVFVVSLKMLVVPVVFVSLVCGSSALGNPSKLGRVGGKTLGLYLFTTAVAITLALLAGAIIGPGRGFDAITDTAFTAKPSPPLSEVFINIFPSNPIKAMAEGNMLQVIVFSILFGIAIALIGDKAQRTRKIFEELNEIIMKMITILMLLAPYGVFALLAKVFAEQGFEAIKPLSIYFFTVLGVLVLHAFGTYISLVKFLGRLDPMIFIRKFRRVQLFAFSTASSNATIPITLNTVEKRLGVNNSIASFTVPLGATINMDGTAIMQGVATAFIAQAYNQDLGMTAYLQVVLTATLASIGTAGVPGVGLITLAMVLQQVNLPVEGIALIIGVDRLLDMVRTAVNVTGDAAVTCVVAKSEEQMDLSIYEDPEAGHAEEDDVERKAKA